MGEKMRFLFSFLLLVVLFVLPVRAATMCVPDLSTCESCTDGTYDGYSWSANCCGIPVSGVALPYLQTGGSSLTISLDDTEAAARGIGSAMAALCVMLKPVVASNGFLGRCIVPPYTSLKAAERCAEHFIPKCVFTQCTLPYIMSCGSGGS